MMHRRGPARIRLLRAFSTGELLTHAVTPASFQRRCPRERPPVGEAKVSSTTRGYTSMRDPMVTDKEEAGEENRTPVLSLEGSCSAIELRPRGLDIVPL